MNDIRSTETHDRFTQVSGEFKRVYGWRRDEYGQDEPVMVLYRARHATQVPFGVTLNTAYRFTEPRHLMHCAVKALEHFGMLVTKDSAIKLATVIQDGLEDLIRMPPRPTGVDRKRDDPDAIVTVNGKEYAAWE